jgi:3-oxoacyl-[acyl-carrier-protein] synthase II
MYYIRSASSVTCQPSFNNPGFSAGIEAPEMGRALVLPDFKTYINPALIRRMSEILRISVACSKNALDAAGVAQPDAIITGTGLGCLYDTEKFLNNALTIEGGMIPPTSFIQSTHNTIAGQISLLLENRSYNMTHTQNTVSFERSLEDALLWLDEGLGNVLVGAADEVIPQLDDIFAGMGLQHLQLTSGASFFVLSKERANAKVVVSDVAVYPADHPTAVNDFLSKNNLPDSGIGLVLYASHDLRGTEKTTAEFPGAVTIDYQQLSGVYATNIAFAMHLAADIMEQGTMKMPNGSGIKNALLLNTLNPAHTGLTLLQLL